jgi:hypothetical protein
MFELRRGSLEREALLAAAAAATLSSLLLWLGPPGNDLPAHLYQQALFVKHGFVLWSNFWYAGRYSFVTYSVLYYPLSALLGIKVLALASVTAAALAFAVVVGREWGPAARISSRSFALLWAGTVLSGAFPFALGFALALLALWAVQEGHRGRFAVLGVLAFAASPLAFLLLAVTLGGIAVAGRSSRRSLVLPAVVVAGCGLVEIALYRLFPSGGRYPFAALQLVPAAAFCGLGALAAMRSPRGRPLLGLLLVYFGACLAAFVIPSGVGSNVERLRYAAVPIALLAVSVAGWRPLRLALPLLAVAAAWNVPPLVANFSHAAADPGATPGYWSPAVRFLHRNLGRDYRVEAVDTLEHWPAIRLPQAGIPIVRGWYRQDDFPSNSILYGRFGPAAYSAWLRRLGVRYVVLSDAPPDYSSRGEAAVLRSGRSGLETVLRTRHLTVLEVPRPRPLVSGPAPARIASLGQARMVVRVAAPGRYRVAVRFSPYWRTLHGCVSRGRDGFVRLTVPRPGLIDLSFRVSVGRGVQALTGLGPRRYCGA